MKISKEQVAANRRQIIDAAAQTFQARGVEAVGVNEIMKACGLTHGGFYNHFESKEDLVAEAMQSAFEPALQTANHLLESKKGMREAINGYLSESHRDAPELGCPSAGFACDAARQAEAAQKIYADGINEYFKAFEKQMQGTPAKRRKAAIRTFTTMVGAMLLARATRGADDQLSDEILKAIREELLTELK